MPTKAVILMRTAEANRSSKCRVGKLSWALRLPTAAAILTFALWPVNDKTVSSKVVIASAVSGLGFASTRVNQAHQPDRAPKGMVWIPGGEFSMGANDPSDMDPVGMNAAVDARPVHR